MRGQNNASKLHTLRCAGYNLGLLLRKVWGLGKPRSGAERGGEVFLTSLALLAAAVCAITFRQPLPAFESLLLAIIFLGTQVFSNVRNKAIF